MSSEKGKVKWQCQVRRAGLGENGWVRLEWLGPVRWAGSGENGLVRLEWKYQIKMARSRSARKANGKLVWQ